MGKYFDQKAEKMKRKDVFDFIAFLISKQKLRKSFKYKDFDRIYDFAQSYIGKGYYDRISMNQFKEEFRQLADIVKASNPKVIVEIGTKKGGSFFIWSRYTNANHLISIDLPGGIHGGGYDRKKIPFLQYFVSDKNEAKVSVILGDSHALDTVQKLGEVLNGEKIDFLFIDGDHTYEGVKADFELYSPLIREGGIIAFHDIVESDYHHSMNCYVDKLWNEIKGQYKYLEIIEKPHQHKYGIGILFV